MIVARNGTVAFAQDFLLNDDKLLSALQTSAQCTLSLHATRSSWTFLSVCSNRTICN